jgi:hypothetical protein
MKPCAYAMAIERYRPKTCTSWKPKPVLDASSISDLLLLHYLIGGVLREMQPYKFVTASDRRVGDLVSSAPVLPKLVIGLPQF